MEMYVGDIVSYMIARNYDWWFRSAEFGISSL